MRRNISIANRHRRTRPTCSAIAFANDQRADQFGVTDRPAAGAGRDVREALGNLPQLEGPGGADFTVYTKKDLTVRRGEKAIVTLFRKRA